MYTFYTFPFILILIFGALIAFFIGDMLSRAQSLDMGVQLVVPREIGIITAIFIMASPLVFTFYTDVLFPFIESFLQQA